ERSVEALRSYGIVEESIDSEGVRLLGFVGHLRSYLILIDQIPVSIGEPHGHARTCEEAGLIVYPRRRPVVVVGVELDPVFEFNLRLGIVVAPRNAVCAIGPWREQIGELTCKVAELGGIKRLQARWRPI